MTDLDYIPQHLLLNCIVYNFTMICKSHRAMRRHSTNVMQALTLV